MKIGPLVKKFPLILSFIFNNIKEPEKVPLLLELNCDASANRDLYVHFSTNGINYLLYKLSTNPLDGFYSTQLNWTGT